MLSTGLVESLIDKEVIDVMTDLEDTLIAFNLMDSPIICIHKTSYTDWDITDTPEELFQVQDEELFDSFVGETIENIEICSEDEDGELIFTFKNGTSVTLAKGVCGEWESLD